ncbi:MAG: HdeD family acid-resistance protein [Bacteroidota bacterium]|nr:HdeD family acid-resistance protein [Bacteroidota bacterium]
MNQLAYNWWTVLLRGVLAIVVGLLAFFLPGITLAVLITLFGVFALMEGAFLIISGIRYRRQQERWWVLILQGIISMGAGILAFTEPLATAIALLYLVASWAIISGVLEIVVAIRLRKEMEGEWMLILDGVITVLFGLAMVLVPAAGLLVWIWMIGGFKLASGILLLILALRLRKAQRSSGHAGISNFNMGVNH